jgi:DNA polymerase-3 subunit delta'
LAGTHPDVELLAKPADRSFIPIELLIGDKQHRMREGLCARIALRPTRGRRKVAIIDDADLLSIEGANCLLKTLEEPPVGSVLILVGTSAQRQLPTIRSRCQIVRFQPLEPEVAARLLIDQQIVDDPAEALRLATSANGSLERAAEMVAPELWQFRAELHERLDTQDWNSLELAQTIGRFVDEAGTAAPERRQRLKQVLEMAIDFYRQLLFASNGAAMADTAPRLAAPWSSDPERAVHCLERCLAARAHVDSNANQSTNIDAWMDELSQLAQGEKGLDLAW